MIYWTNMAETKETIEDITKRRYTLHFMLKSAVGVEGAHNFSQEISKKVETLGGKIETSMCGEQTRIFAYPIKKEGQGFLCETVFLIEPEKIKDLYNDLKNEDSVLRHVIETKKPTQKSVKLRMEKERRRSIKKEGKSLTEKDEKAEPITKQEAKKRDKISIEEIDKKLDEIIKNI